MKGFCWRSVECGELCSIDRNIRMQGCHRCVVEKAIYLDRSVINCKCKEVFRFSKGVVVERSAIIRDGERGGQGAVLEGSIFWLRKLG